MNILQKIWSAFCAIRWPVLRCRSFKCFLGGFWKSTKKNELYSLCILVTCILATSISVSKHSGSSNHPEVHGDIYWLFEVEQTRRNEREAVLSLNYDVMQVIRSASWLICAQTFEFDWFLTPMHDLYLLTLVLTPRLFVLLDPSGRRPQSAARASRTFPASYATQTETPEREINSESSCKPNSMHSGL